jgi:hypothetical protein
MDPGAIAGIVIGVLVGVGVLAGTGFGVFTKRLSMDTGMAIFVALITATNFGLSTSIGSINDKLSKTRALISLFVLNSVVIAALLLHLGLTTYTNFQRTSIQTSYKYIHVLIPVCVIVSIVSLSATAMKQLAKSGATKLL